MNYFSTPYKVDWLKLAVIARPGDRQNLAKNIITDLENTFSAQCFDVTSGRMNYAVRYPVGYHRGKNQIIAANVQYGGNTSGKRGEHVQFECSGENADFYYRNSESLYDEAYIQRLDLAYDVTGDFEGIVNRVAALDEFKRVKRSTVRSVENGIECATTYFGARESAYFIRIYEKGKQVGGDPEWVRVEIEFKPTKTSVDFAVLSYEQFLQHPENILTSCRHVRAMMCELFESSDSLPAYEARTEKTLPPTVSSFCHMVEQYAAIMAGINELYDIGDMLDIVHQVHQLKQSDEAEVRDSVRGEIMDYLAARSRNHCDAHVRAFYQDRKPGLTPV